VFCFSDGGSFPIKLVLYSLCTMFLMVFISVSFAFLVTDMCIIDLLSS
jgi:hypothetical protein